jgi:hypothetical protein
VHQQALIEVALKRKREPVMLGEGVVVDIVPSGS